MCLIQISQKPNRVLVASVFVNPFGVFDNFWDISFKLFNLLPTFYFKVVFSPLSGKNNLKTVCTKLYERGKLSFLKFSNYPNIRILFKPLNIINEFSRFH